MRPKPSISRLQRMDANPDSDQGNELHNDKYPHLEVTMIKARMTSALNTDASNV